MKKTEGRPQSAIAITPEQEQEYRRNKTLKPNLDFLNKPHKQLKLKFNE